MATLSECAVEFPTDKAALGYTEFYERHFRHLRAEPFELLEIGTSEGGSLRMWGSWAPYARLVGVDIAPLVEVNTDHVHTVVSDIRDYTPDRPVDIIIDDGSHDPAEIVDTLDRLWPHLKPGGFYAIEDMEVHSPTYPNWRPEMAVPTEALMGRLANTCRGVCLGEKPAGAVALFAYPRLLILEKEP